MYTAATRRATRRKRSVRTASGRGFACGTKSMSESSLTQRPCSVVGAMRPLEVVNTLRKTPGRLRRTQREHEQQHEDQPVGCADMMKLAQGQIGGRGIGRGSSGSGFVHCRWL